MPCAYVLAEAGLTLEDLSAVAFYDKPYLKFERLLETYHAFAPRGLKSFLLGHAGLDQGKALHDEAACGTSWPRWATGQPQLLFPEHHLSHAASAFYPSPFEEAAILTIDGVGEWATTTIGHGQGKDITILRELHFPHSAGPALFRLHLLLRIQGQQRRIQAHGAGALRQSRGRPGDGAGGS